MALQSFSLRRVRALQQQRTGDLSDLGVGGYTAAVSSSRDRRLIATA
jgi:hypothetical protein